MDDRFISRQMRSRYEVICVFLHKRCMKKIGFYFQVLNISYVKTPLSNCHLYTLAKLLNLQSNEALEILSRSIQGTLVTNLL